MEDLQQLLQSILIGLLFSYLLANLISLLVSFKDSNLSISRDVSPSTLPNSLPGTSLASGSSDSLIGQHNKASDESDSDIQGKDSDDWEGVESTDLDDAFCSASAFVATIAADKTQIPVEKQLQLYGFYKIATEGPCSTPQPSPLKLSERSKWHAWKKLGDMDGKEAMESYITVVTELFPFWDAGVKSSDTDHKGPMGPVFSSMVYDDGSENETAMEAIHGFAREGEQEDLQRCIENGVSVNLKDSEGRTPLHWAVDRGHVSIVEQLLQHNANINSADDEGQTPLHYAAICGREDIAKHLLNHGADADAKDSDGMTPKDLADSFTLS